MLTDRDLKAAAFLLAHDFASGKGISGVLLTSHSSGGTGNSRAVPSLEQLAARLTSMDLTNTNDHIQAALERSVDTARYWQEPDGVDVLAGRPIITKALTPLAEQLVMAPGSQWFRASRQIEQWSIDWRSPTGLALLSTDPRGTLKEWARKERAEEDRAARERPVDPHANVSGTWWSIPHGLVRTVGHVPAALSLVEDSLGWERATAIPVRGTGKTLEIRTAADWISLCRRFPLEVTASRRHDWFRAMGRHGRWVIPDWEKVAGEWDAAHLTVLGYLNGATRPLQVDTRTATVIAGWDPDVTIWLRDVVRKGDGPWQTWQRTHGDRWAPVSQ